MNNAYLEEPLRRGSCSRTRAPPRARAAGSPLEAGSGSTNSPGFQISGMGFRFRVYDEECRLQEAWLLGRAPPEPVQVRQTLLPRWSKCRLMSERERARERERERETEPRRAPSKPVQVRQTLLPKVSLSTQPSNQGFLINQPSFLSKSSTPSQPRFDTTTRQPRFNTFFFTLVTGPRRSLSLKLSDTRVYEPQIPPCVSGRSKP